MAARSFTPSETFKLVVFLERDIEARFPDKNTPILLYCAGGARSALAAHNLQLMGYTHVASMIGGYKGWVQRQLPVVQD